MSDQRLAWWSDEVLDRDRWGRLVTPALEKLVRARDRERLPHALLMVGPPGLGRELAAVEAAVLAVCPDARAPWSEGSCADRVRRGIHPDVVAMLPEGPRGGMIKIEPVREKVVTVVASKPFEGACRVWIFDGVEAGRLNVNAANAFLKTLEEPPRHARFILLAANPEAVLPTIRSRCQQIRLPGVVAVARLLQDHSMPPELASVAVEGDRLHAAITETQSALEAGLEGEPRLLLRLPHVLPDEAPPFAIVAAVALEMAGEDDDEELARLAADLLAAENRARALNLNVGGQLTSRLMQWFRDQQSQI
jgi:hypothetical protein